MCFLAFCYFDAFSHTVAFWQPPLSRIVPAHGRFLAALAISQHSRTRSLLAALAISQRSRTRSLFGSFCYLPAFSYTVAFGSSCNLAAFSHTVAIWQLLLFHSNLAHGRYLAAFAISQLSRTRSLLVSFCYSTAFSHTVANWQLLLFHSILAHGHFLAALAISQHPYTVLIRSLFLLFAQYMGFLF